MVGVRQHDLGAEVAQLVRRSGLDGRLRPYRHERGRVHGTAREAEGPRAGGTLGGVQLELEQGSDGQGNSLDNRQSWSERPGEARHWVAATLGLGCNLIPGERPHSYTANSLLLRKQESALRAGSPSQPLVERGQVSLQKLSQCHIPRIIDRQVSPESPGPRGYDAVGKQVDA